MSDSKVRLSIVLPTIGRPSLRKTLDSIYPQLEYQKDEVIFVGDQEALESDVVQWAWKKRWDRQTFVKHPRGNNWGQTERNFGMRFANGTHVMFMSDDDWYLEGAFARIRATATAHPNKVLIFKMWWNGLVLPRFPSIVQANIDASMFVVPNDPNKLGVWGNRYEGDYDFITSTLDLYEPSDEGPVVFDDFLISEWGGKPLTP